MKKAKRRINAFDFSGENHAVSLVSKDIGGAANQYSTLIMKADADVMVELTMAEFLAKFFGMWSYDASILASMLGYSGEYDLWDEEKIQEKAVILKSIKDSGDIGNSDLTQVVDVVKRLADVNKVKITDLSEILKSADGEDPVGELTEDLEKSSNTSPKTQEDNKDMSDKDTQLAELMKAKEAQEELIKSLQAKVEAQEKLDAERKAAEFTEIAKGLEVAEEEVEGMAVALMKASIDADITPLVELVKSQAVLLKGMKEAEPKGHEHSFETSSNEDPNELIIKAIKAKKESK